MTSTESSPKNEGARSTVKQPTSRRGARSRRLRGLRKHLWWLLLAVAVGTLIAFLIALIWYRSDQDSRESTLLALGGTSVVAWIGLGLWKIPQWQARNVPIAEGGKTRLEIENDTRKTLGEIVSGLGVVAGLLFTWYQINDTRNVAERSLQTTQQGQITELFSQSVNQLGSGAIDVRVGGIYSLEQIALDDPEDYYRPVMEVLAGFVRAHDRFGHPTEDAEQQGPSAQPSGLTLDVRAALIVIARRADPPPESEDLQLNLSEVDLRLMSLNGANFQGVDLTGAHLEGAILTGADLEDAILIGTFTTGMLPTSFEETCLKGANLLRSDISSGQINAAIIDRSTILPDGTNATIDEEGCG